MTLSNASRQRQPRLGLDLAQHHVRTHVTHLGQFERDLVRNWSWSRIPPVTAFKTQSPRRPAAFDDLWTIRDCFVEAAHSKPLRCASAKGSPIASTPRRIQRSSWYAFHFLLSKGSIWNAGKLSRITHGVRGACSSVGGKGAPVRDLRNATRSVTCTLVRCGMTRSVSSRFPTTRRPRLAFAPSA